MVFKWGDRGYPAVRFEYKVASEQYLVAELYKQNSFGCFWEKSQFKFFP